MCMYNWPQLPSCWMDLELLPSLCGWMKKRGFQQMGLFTSGPVALALRLWYMWFPSKMQIFFLIYVTVFFSFIC